MFDPWWKQSSFISLKPQVLVEVGVCDLLQRFYIVSRDQMTEIAQIRCTLAWVFIYLGQTVKI